MKAGELLEKFGIIAILILSMAVGPSFGQILTGKIIGQVSDDEGSFLPGVTVEVSSPELIGGIYSDSTSDKGTYRFVNLPPGVYKLVFKLEGFQTIERLNLRVTVGGTITEDIIMYPSTMEESITVTAETPIVDVKKSSISTIIDGDAIEKLPSGRHSFFDIIKQVPGVIQGGQEFYSRLVGYGSNWESSMYQLDGVDMSNPEIGSAWLYINPEVFAEVEILGIGAPAEYGQFTGAVVNIITKSGGNRFEGSLNYYGQFQKLTSDNNPRDPKEYFSYNRDKFYDASFSLGGPLIKDRLWFFGSYQRYEDSFSPWLSDPEYPRNTNGHKAFFKMSSSLAKDHRLIASFYYEIFNYFYNADPYNLPETVCAERGYTPTWNLLYSWFINSSSILEVKYSGFWTDDDFLPSLGGNINNPVIYDGYTGITSGAPWWPWIYVATRHQANVSFTHFAEDFLGGDHDFKVGVQYNRGTSEAHGGYSGGRRYYNYAGSPIYMYEQDVFSYGGVVNAIGAFIDDSWKIGDRVTVNMGLRFDHSNGHIPSYPVYEEWRETSGKTPRLDELITWNSISPRIGLAFQLTSDQKTLLRASFGRYYDALHIANWEYPGPGVTDWFMYKWDQENQEYVLWDMVPGKMGYAIDPNLKNPYADQYSLGIEREFLPNFSISATFIYKTEKNLIGFEDRGADYEKTDMVSPDNGKTYSVWNQISDLGTNDYWLTNPSRFGETFGQVYKSFQFEIKKRYAHNWQLSASLVWSKADGLNMSAHSIYQQAMTWYVGGFGKDPNDLINAKGFMNNDRTWIFKLSASYSFPWGIMASTNFIYQTGVPIPAFLRVYPNQGVRQILAEPRGNERFKPWTLFDLRLQKTFIVYKTWKIYAFVDVFNVFDSNTVLGYASYNTWSESYREPNSIFYPRRLQIGLRLEF